MAPPNGHSKDSAKPNGAAPNDKAKKQAASKKAKHPGVLPTDEVVKLFQLDLKNRYTAALLAWLWPGAGHLYQGRTAKGLLFMICIVSTFLFGFVAGRGKVAFATPLTMQQIAQSGSSNFLRNRLTQAIDRWPFLCQAGIGAVAIPAVIERQRSLQDRQPLWPGAWFYPPSNVDSNGNAFTSKDDLDNKVIHPSQLAKWNYDMGFYFELGTIYTVIAGLLNLLVVFDAYSGPLIPREPPQQDPAQDKPWPPAKTA